MAVVNGQFWSYTALRHNGPDPLQVGLVLFNLPESAVYAQADNAQLQGVPALIQNARRNGKTVTLRSVALGRLAERDHTGRFMGLKMIAIAGNDVTFEVTDSATVGTVDLTTELANGNVPAQSAPFGLLVTFTEA